MVSKQNVNKKMEVKLVEFLKYARQNTLFILFLQWHFEVGIYITISQIKVMET